MATGYYLLDHRPAIPQCGYPRRGGARASGTIILHDAEGGTDLSGADTGAENVANYIRNRTTYGSYHRLVDRDTRIKMAPIDYETWHSVPDNPWSVGVCVAWTKADLPRMTYAQRRSYYVPFAREVLDVRAEFADRGIRVPIDRFLTAAETQDRKPGISTHSRTDPSRRSDPFGTGSKYEAEFLAVLAELGGKPTTPQQEEPDMDATQAKQLSDIHAVLTGDDRFLKLADGRYPQIDATEETGPDAPKVTFRTGFKQVRLAVLGGLATTVAKAVVKELPDVDPAAVTKAVTNAVDKALADIEITLTKEN